MSKRRQEFHVYHSKESSECSLALIAKYQATSDEALRYKLVMRYMPLVESIASRYARQQVPYEDLVQVGIVGLLVAIRRFNLRRGCSFERFAIPTITGEMKRYMRDATWSVHVPRRVKELGPRVKKAWEELTATHRRSPKIIEIADYLGATEEEVLEAMEMARSYRALSFDRPMKTDSEDGTVTLLDVVGREDPGYEKVDRKLLLEKAFEVLNERESKVIHLTFFHNLSQAQAGESLGISQMHVSRLQRRALKKLRNAIHLKLSECI